jgi:thiol:disulfide interchange protein DsbC
MPSNCLRNRFLAALALCLVACAAAAADSGSNEALIRKALEKRLDGIRVEAILPTPIAGIYEAQYRSAEGMQIIYTDATGNYVLQGSLFDMRSGRDLTEEKLQALNAVPLSSLPLDLAVKVQRGNGKRVLAMFSDPHCPYCRKFERILQQVDDVTVYVFMYPVIRPDLAKHSKAVWCSADRSKAWIELALKGEPPLTDASCDTPLEKIRELGHRLGVNSTPTLILADGRRISGGLGLADLTRLLDSSASTPGAPARKVAR